MRNFDLDAPEYHHDVARVNSSAFKLFHMLGTFFFGLVALLTIIPQTLVVLLDMVRLVFGIPYRVLMRASTRADTRLGQRAENVLPRIS